VIMVRKLIVALCILSILAAPVFSQTQKVKQKKSVLKQKLSQVDSKINSITKNLREKKAAKSDAIEDLRVTDDKIESMQSKIARSQIKIAGYESDISIIDKNLVLIQKNLDRRKGLLRKRVVDIYKGGDLQYVNVLLDTTDMWSFLTQSFYLKKMIDYDTDLIKEINADKKKVVLEKQKKLRLVSNIRNSQDDLISLRDKQRNLAELKREKIADIEKDKDQLEAVLSALERDSNRIEKQILAMQQTASGKKRYARAFNGSLGLPCSGRISSGFGMRFHPIRRIYKLHTGVDIATPIGTPVHASGSGTVISAGWLGAYGNAVIIDHGGGVSTLYGHCSSLNVSVGRTVSKGQVIARSGSTGFSTGPHVHFEKRINGRPVSPL